MTEEYPGNRDNVPNKQVLLAWHELGLWNETNAQLSLCFNI